MKPAREANRITRIWREAGPGNYPIKLSAVINEIVNKSSNGDQLEVVCRSADSFEGALVKGSLRSWCAVLNSNIRAAGRRRFTLAHEIAHFLGHRAFGREFRDTTDQLHDFEHDEFEKQANQFAAQLLMPPDIVRPFTNVPFTMDRLTELSEALAVSKQAAGLRWVNISQELVGFVVARDGFIVWGRASDAAYKRGVFFRSGSELNTASIANDVRGANERTTKQHEAGAWHQQLQCREDAYSTSMGYTYICLEFFD